MTNPSVLGNIYEALQELDEIGACETRKDYIKAMSLIRDICQNRIDIATQLLREGEE